MPPPSSSPAPQLQTTCPYLHRVITNTSCRLHGWPGQHSTTQPIGWNNGPPISVTEFRFTKGHSYDVHRGHSHDVHICRSRRPTDDGVALRDIWLLRLRALLARARGGCRG